jgi:hypothetical protein
MATKHAVLFYLASFFVLNSDNVVLAAPRRAANNAAIGSVQVLDVGDFCRDRVSQPAGPDGQCGNALKVIFVNGKSLVIQKESWAAAIWGYEISDDHLSLIWFLLDKQEFFNGDVLATRAFRVGHQIHAFDCEHVGNELDHYFAERGRWLVLSCGAFHQLGYAARLLFDVASGHKISQINATEQGETPRGAPHWAQHE